MSKFDENLAALEYRAYIEEKLSTCFSFRDWCEHTYNEDITDSTKVVVNIDMKYRPIPAVDFITVDLTAVREKEDV